jgi:hypothetical protein
MTLSNFDWTDKTSVKWFILLPTGHEGPYSLDQLISLCDKKKISAEARVWAEGLPESVALKLALSAKNVTQAVPDLPPIPEDEVPPIPEVSEVGPLIPEEIKTDNLKKATLFPVWGFLSIAVIVLFFFVFASIFKNYEKFDVKRLPKMTLSLHQRIMGENKFESWNKKIFFKEYLPDDQGHIWLVTSSFHKCFVEATFSSIQDKLLALKDEKILFKTEGKLSGHIVEFSRFEFLNGNKIIPGLYEMDVKAFGCEWDGFVANIMNKFSSPDENYMGRQKVVLFSKGASEFNAILNRVIKKKSEIEIKQQNQNELFWQDLQQKLETLNAITLSIEAHFLDFLDGGPDKFPKNLKLMINNYSRQFGSFLTNFVVENENYFKNLNSDANGISNKRNYELMVRMSSKRIGLESMRFIEEFQQNKKPTNKDIKTYTKRVKSTFSSIKTNLNEKIIQISEDRSQ